MQSPSMSTLWYVLYYRLAIVTNVLTLKHVRYFALSLCINWNVSISFYHLSECNYSGSVSSTEICIYLWNCKNPILRGLVTKLPYLSFNVTFQMKLAPPPYNVEDFECVSAIARLIDLAMTSIAIICLLKRPCLQGRVDPMKHCTLVVPVGFCPHAIQI